MTSSWRALRSRGDNTECQTHGDAWLGAGRNWCLVPGREKEKHLHFEFSDSPGTRLNSSFSFKICFSSDSHPPVLRTCVGQLLLPFCIQLSHKLSPEVYSNPEPTNRAQNQHTWLRRLGNGLAWSISPASST